MIIDSHHHFWNYNHQEYSWIDGEFAPLRQDYTPTTLKPLLDETGVKGVISVQARTSLQETEWLLSLAQANDWILGVVGWVDLLSTEAGDQLDRYSSNPKFRSVRHIIQSEIDPEFMERTDFNAGVREVTRRDLAYDLLVYSEQIKSSIKLVDRHPEQSFILDHIGKPAIRNSEFKSWAGSIRELGKRAHVSCKISGIVTEARQDQCHIDTLEPYLEVVLEAFGTERLMFGSDWPVCTIRSSYGDWLQLVKQWIQKLSLEEQSKILYKNCAQTYRINTFKE